MLFIYRFSDYLFNANTALEKLRSREWDGVLLSNDVTINFFNFKNKSWRRIGYTHDVVRPVTPVFYFNKNSILTEIFNQKIQACSESGLIQHWISQYRQRIKVIKHREPKTLEISNILAILEISALIYFIAFIVFTSEIFTNKFERIRRVLDYLTY